MYNSEQSAIPAKQFRILSHLKDHRLIWISFLLSFLVFYFFRFFDQYVYQIFLAERYLAFHTVVEFASIIMYVSSFLLIYYVGDHDNRLYMKILGSTLLFVALIDFWHTFYYEGMAGLVTDSSVQAATSFWIIGRLGFA
ncbi:MAG TPA: hypothetical protein DHN33_04645, partial [Eubacteriaceae bacterium]|nr:hypothetical protein [Eubacteriaceae bacterium]